MAGNRQPDRKFIATLLLLFALPLFAWRTSPWLVALWNEPEPQALPPMQAVIAIPERMDLNDPAFRNSEVLREHLAQYQFAKRYAQEHNLQSVADIASGTCYGMDILKEAVPVVDGYDKEDFCGNYVMDLDKEDWNRKYDAIVSFETIEHLANPEFFLENAVRSAPVLLLSAPVNEGPENPHHLQHWSDEELPALLERYYASCEYFHRVGDVYEPHYIGGFDLFAVCRSRGSPLQGHPAP